MIPFEMVVHDKFTYSSLKVTVVHTNPDLIDTFGVVLFRQFSPARVFSAVFASLVRSFRSRAALQLEILALCHQLVSCIAP